MALFHLSASIVKRSAGRSLGEEKADEGLAAAVFALKDEVELRGSLFAEEEAAVVRAAGTGETAFWYS